MMATRASAPLLPRASATARAAGQLATETLQIDASWESSKSSAWHSMPFVNAAFAAGRETSPPMTVASGSPPCPAMTARPSVAIPLAYAARPQPSVSRRCSFACSRTSAGMSSSRREVVQFAILSAAVGMSPLLFGPDEIRPLHGPGLVGLGEGVAHLGGVSLVDHECSLELDHDLASLVQASAAHRDDSDARVRLGLALVG